MSPPVSVQADVPNKLVQMAVWTLALHPPRETHQAVDVLYVCSHLETLHVLKQRYGGGLQTSAPSSHWYDGRVRKTITCLILRFVSPSRFDVSM